MMMMKDQDREMEAVASTVVNLKEIATVMGNELDEQSRYYFPKIAQMDLGFHIQF